MTWKFENEAVPVNVFPPRNLRKGPARSGNWVEVYKEEMDSTTPKTVSTTLNTTLITTPMIPHEEVYGLKLFSSRPIFI